MLKWDSFKPSCSSELEAENNRCHFNSKSWMKFIRPVKKDVKKPVLPASQPIPDFEGVQERLRTDQQKWEKI